LFAHCLFFILYIKPDLKQPVGLLLYSAVPGSGYYAIFYSTLVIN